MPNRPLLLGHRGARSEKSILENTLASFDLALARGCDGFEFDVRISADDKAVICHDEETRGMPVAKCSAAKLALPLLHEVLKRYQSTAFLDIEIKVPGLEAITLDLLEKYQPTRGYVISSFLPEVLIAAFGMDNKLPLGLICETPSQLSQWRTLPLQYLIPHYSIMSEVQISEAQDAGRKVLVWTVNTMSDMKRFATWGVDGVISDHPARLARALGLRDE
jgi:glycerophosphoryl diester phosphodiesterase